MQMNIRLSAGRKNMCVLKGSYQQKCCVGRWLGWRFIILCMYPGISCRSTFITKEPMNWWLISPCIALLLVQENPNMPPVSHTPIIPFHHPQMKGIFPNINCFSTGGRFGYVPFRGFGTENSYLEPPTTNHKKMDGCLVISNHFLYKDLANIIQLKHPFIRWLGSLGFQVGRAWFHPKVIGQVLQQLEQSAGKPSERSDERGQSRNPLPPYPWRIHVSDQIIATS